MTTIIWNRPDGGISITQLTPEAIANGVSLQKHAAVLQQQGDIPQDYTAIAFGIEITLDRYFRDAWVHDNGQLSINLEKAKEIQKSKLRELRQPILNNLDTLYMKADEIGDINQKKQIAQQKQILRDITKIPDILSATDLTSLKNAGLSALES